MSNRGNNDRGNNNNNNNNNTCVVCYKKVRYYSIGMCEHPVCYECSTRMRVLCKQNECPICRQDLPKVVFTKVNKPFRLLKKGDLWDSTYKIYFETTEIQEDFQRLLSHECNVCQDCQIFSSFDNLKDHMKRKHNLHYCDLCVDNVKIFSRERRSYTKTDLEVHQRVGDKDDKSHKGHPLCKFCEKRYVDNDELYRHLRRDHLFCHFCDADGLHHYYHSYDCLRDHFRQEHYLCQEGECADEQFTSVFRTDIDLKAHKASVHGKLLGKAAAKQARTLDLEFNLAPRANNDFRHRRGGGSAGMNRNPRDESGSSNYSRNPHIYQRPETPPQEEEPTFVRQQLCDVQSTQEFPTLGNAPAGPSFVPSMGRGRNSLTVRGVLRNNYNENFPALGPDAIAPNNSSTASNKLKKSFNASVSSSKPSNANTGAKPKTTSTNPVTKVNQRPNGTVMTRLTCGPGLRINKISGVTRDMDFPALGSSVAEAATPTSSWSKVTCVKPEEMPRSTKVAPQPYVPPPARTGSDFPSLSKPSKTSNLVSSAPTKTPAPLGPSWLNETDSTKGKAKKKKIKQPQNIANNNGNTTINNDSSIINDKFSNDNVNKNTNKIKEIQESCKKTQNKTKQNFNQENGKQNLENLSGNKIEKTIVDVSVSSPRKRLEFKTESFNNTTNNNDKNNVEDFPTLGRTLSRPPGLPSPPPGFTAAPPGFTNRLGDNNYYSIVPDDKRQQQSASSSYYTYMTPTNFQRRNQNLIAEFNNCFGSDESEELKAFRYLSGLFRTGACDADGYYRQCRTMMGTRAFNRIFPELLALLPEIKKQRELFEIHKREVKNATGSDKVNGLVACANCGQILRNSDLHDHASSHTLENHFPVLSRAASNNGSWNKK